MRLPRDVSGAQLASSLGRCGYERTRQTGSHLRLTAHHRGQDHHVTVPRHAVLKVGTLNAILLEVAAQLELSKAELLELLFDG